MKIFVLAFVFFLLAFAGLAAGVIMRRRGLRSSCNAAKSCKPECRCESDLDSSMQAQSNCHKKS